MPDMKAAVMYKPGGPEVLQIERRPIPSPEEGQVLLRVKAFGLNRSEMFTRVRWELCRVHLCSRGTGPEN